jgi:hypothetical protein
MKQQFAVTHRYSALQETENACLTSNRLDNKHFMVLRKHRDKYFGCGHKTMIQGLFLTRTSFDVLCGTGQIAVLRTTCLGYSVWKFYLEGPVSEGRAF